MSDGRFLSDSALLFWILTLMFFVIGFFIYRSENKSLEESIKKTSESNKEGYIEIYTLYNQYIENTKINWYNRGQFSQEVLSSLEPLKNILLENPEIFIEEYFYGYRLITMQKYLYFTGYVTDDINMTEEELSDFTLESGLSLEYWENKLIELSKSKNMNLFKSKLSDYKIELSNDDEIITDGYFFLKIIRENKALKDIKIETGNQNMKIYGTSDQDTLYVGLIDYAPESYRHNNLFLKVNNELSFCVIFENLIEHYNCDDDEKIKIPYWFQSKWLF
jgi:hypothetical protein